MDLVAIGVHGRPDDPVPPLPVEARPDRRLRRGRAAGRDRGPARPRPDGLRRPPRGRVAVGRRAPRRRARGHAVDVGQPGHRRGRRRVRGDRDRRPVGCPLGPAPRRRPCRPRCRSPTRPTASGASRPSGWVRTYLPGSRPGRGGARTRIAASLTYSLPYRVPGGPPVSNALPPGAARLVERDTGTVLPDLPGFPQAVPYAADAGEHTIAIQPGVDLQPCTWYRAEVTASLIDARGEPVVPHSWEFRTGLDAAGTACPDDPPADDVLAALTARAHRDLLGREPDPTETASWVDRLGDGDPRSALADALVGSAEHRGRLVDLLFALDVGRPPTSRGAHGVDELAWPPARRSTCGGCCWPRRPVTPSATPRAGWRSAYRTRPRPGGHAHRGGDLGRAPRRRAHADLGRAHDRRRARGPPGDGPLDHRGSPPPGPDRSASCAVGARAIKGARDWRPFTAQIVAGDEYLALRGRLTRARRPRSTGLTTVTVARWPSPTSCRPT